MTQGTSGCCLWPPRPALLISQIPRLFGSAAQGSKGLGMAPEPDAKQEVRSSIVCQCASARQGWRDPTPALRALLIRRAARPCAVTPSLSCKRQPSRSGKRAKSSSQMPPLQVCTAICSQSPSVQPTCTSPLRANLASLRTGQRAVCACCACCACRRDRDSGQVLWQLSLPIHERSAALGSRLFHLQGTYNIDMYARFTRAYQPHVCPRLQASQLRQGNAASMKESETCVFWCMCVCACVGVLCVLQLEFASAYHRLCGRKVLFPQAFHCTGMPIKVCTHIHIHTLPHYVAGSCLLQH